MRTHKHMRIHARCMRESLKLTNGSLPVHRKRRPSIHWEWAHQTGGWWKTWLPLLHLNTQTDRHVHEEKGILRYWMYMDFPSQRIQLEENFYLKPVLIQDILYKYICIPYSGYFSQGKIFVVLWLRSKSRNIYPWTVTIDSTSHAH